MAYTDTSNYSGLSAEEKTAVDAAVVAIIAAFADTAGDQNKKGNVSAILLEIVNGQAEE